MIHDIYTQARSGRGAGRAASRPIESRINPWLLWRPERPPAPQVLTVAELAECRCPDLCNRDHANE